MSALPTTTRNDDEPTIPKLLSIPKRKHQHDYLLVVNAIQRCDDTRRTI